MPRLVNKLPRYSLHKPSGLAKVKFGGKVTYLGKHGTPESHAAYAAFVARLPKPEDPTTPPEPAPGAILMVGEIVLHYNAHALRYYARDGVPTGEHVTIRAALRPLVNLFGEIPAREFGPKRMKALQAAMIKLDWSRRYVNKACGITKRCFTWAASEELILAETAMALRTVPGLKKGRTAAREKPDVAAVTDADIETTLPELGSVIADMVRIQRLCGCRPGELLGMTVEAINRTDPQCWVFTPGSHKTQHHGKGRTIFLGPKAIDLLVSHLVAAGTGRIFPILRDGYRQAILRACERAGVTPWTPNRLRHAAATEFRAKFGLEAAQVLLGHSRADVTQTYAERDLKKAADVKRKIG